MITQMTPTIVLDTPNILYYKLQNGNNQFTKNLIALLKFLNQKIRLVAIITPKMIREFPKQTNFLCEMINRKGGRAQITNHHDPDVIILQEADNLSGFIITNDKFRQKKYQSYKSRMRVIRFSIQENLLIPRSKFWKKIFGGS